MVRPRVDVVVPFRGTAAQLEEVAARLQGLRLEEGDTIVIVDNSSAPATALRRRQPGLTLLSASERQTPGYARNRGFEAGAAPWVVFLDADTIAPPDLLGRYFERAPRAETGLLAGGLQDEPVGRDGPAPARFAYLMEKMSQRQTFRLGEWGFSQTANAACRRAALEAVGGFREDIRAGEDADLCYRLRRAGWEIERREEAAAVHLNRTTVRGFVAQKAIHGAAAAWLDREYPGSFPPRRRPGLVLWGARAAAGGLLQALRNRDRDAAVRALFDALEQLTYEFGRSLPNQRR